MKLNISSTMQKLSLLSFGRRVKSLLLLQFIAQIVIVCNVAGQDVFESYRSSWLNKAENNKPVLQYQQKSPIGLVRITEDTACYQNLRVLKSGTIEDYYNSTLKTNNSVIIDFGEHMVGYFQFVIVPTRAADAPVRLKFTFGEVPAELYYSFDLYKGDLSRAWLQDEIINVDVLPDTIKLPRRYAFRYVKIELLAYSSDYDVKVKDIKCLAVSSANEDKTAAKSELTPSFQDIEKVSLKTIRDCMQTVFEDGPKRDRRLWIGDFKLQALANYYSYRNTELVKRCLYMMAGTADSSGLLYGTAFEHPYLHPQKHHPIDYCILYNSVLLDYYHATSDLSVIQDLWPVAKQQVLHILPYISKEGIFKLPDNWWAFVDWNNELNKQTALQGIIIYSFSQTMELAKVLNKSDEIAFLPAIIKKMQDASKRSLFDKKLQLFVSGDSRQVSTASQVWMILSRAVTAKDGKRILEQLSLQNNVVKPVSPYMYHYVLEAMIACGMYDNARKLIASYWGGMIKKGADTFWEVYVPGNDFVTPYHSYQINSYCHAWSCTPVYFIRKYNKELFGLK